jgi:hypothetical protein
LCWEFGRDLISRGNGCKKIAYLGELHDIATRADLRRQRFEGARCDIVLWAHAQERDGANAASLRETEQAGAPGAVDVRDLLTEEELKCSGIDRVRRRPEYPVQDDGSRRCHSLRNDRVERAGATDAVQPHLGPAAIIDLGERARRRDDAARHAAAVGTDRQEQTAKRVMDTGCAFCEPGGCPHQRPGICSMSY